ncbi:MAG: hypothetical protein FJZ60_01315 [Chlamydiae bacterium]|nr:hypothetical protein [Chlamydiota bacterium]
MTPDLITTQIKTDLEKIFFTPLLQNNKHIKKVAETIIRFQQSYHDLDENRDEVYLKDDMRVYYQLNGPGAKNPGSLCVELGVFMTHKEKNFSIWVEVPREFSQNRALKYRLVVSAAEKKVKKPLQDQFSKVQQNAHLLDKTGIIPKFYPTVKFRDQTCYFQKFYPEMDLTFQKDLFKDMAKLSGLVLDLLVKVKLLHQMGFAHGDLRPENILVKKARHTSLLSCKLADLETTHPISTKATLLGYFSHLSPETAIQILQTRLEVDPKTNDVWALGCTLFYLFSSKNQTFMDSILKSYFPISSPKDHEDFYFLTLKCLGDLKERESFEKYTAKVIKRELPERLQPLLQQILSVDPSRRPTIDEIIGQFSTIFSSELGSLTAEVLVAQGGAHAAEPQVALCDDPSDPIAGGAVAKTYSRPFPKIEESEGRAAPAGLDGFLDWLAHIAY